MPRQVVLATCALLVACGPVFVPSEPSASKQGIVGGSLDVGDEQVFQLKIVGVPSGSGNCSATLIGARTLLTAAHCVDPRRFGATSLVITATNVTDTSTAGPVDTLKVVETRFHPMWNLLTLDNDIGVALLENSPGLEPKAWNAQSVATFGGKPLRAVGYGAASADAGFPGIKREVGLTFRQLTADQIWIGDQESKGICSGDSGGPSFHTFTDGVERVVGVHSTASLAAYCFDGTDQRVDIHAGFIRGWLMEKEAAACWHDGRCVATGCAAVDVDCVCGTDGMCTDKCPNLLLDADCPADCVTNGVCSTKACPRPDVDCGYFTGDCAVPQDCLSGRCVTDPQHPSPYCSSTCGANAECAPSMECDATSTCRYKQLPMVRAGAPCTPGQQVCEPGAMCLAPAGKASICMEMCGKDSDCAPDGVCVGDTPISPMFCRLPVVLPVLTLEGAAGPANGCSAAPGGLWALLALAGLWRSRKQT